LGFLALVVLKSLVFPSNPIPYVPSLRVDLVALPDVLKKDRQDLDQSPPPENLTESLREAEASAVRTAEKDAKTSDAPDDAAEAGQKTAQPPGAIALATKADPAKERAQRSKKLKNALQRIRSLEKIAAQKDPQNDSPKAAESRSATVIKGNRLSPGTSLSGDARETSEASYFDRVRSRLQANWALPVWLARRGLSAKAQIRLDRRGRLLALAFTQVSGDPRFDEAVKNAILQSQPFPFPPEELSTALASDGILVGFPL
jgi:TolA protein